MPLLLDSTAVVTIVVVVFGRWGKGGKLLGRGQQEAGTAEITTESSSSSRLWEPVCLLRTNDIPAEAFTVERSDSEAREMDWGIEQEEKGRTERGGYHELGR